jgi:hypothetical protein
MTDRNLEVKYNDHISTITNLDMFYGAMMRSFGKYVR